MAKCSISGEKFINFVFSPCIGLLVSPDVNELCLRDNLTFEELLRPFSQLSRDVTFRDNNNVIHSVKNLQLKFFDVTASSVPKRTIQSLLQYFVSVCSTDNTIRSQQFCDGCSSVVVPTSLPWFEVWRYLFVTNLKPFEHEFINHNLACIFVLTTAHPDPIRGFTELTQSQSNQQHHLSGSYPFWFTENILKFYVLLHDGSSNIRQSSVDEIFSQVKTTFGAVNCHLLTIFTASSENKMLSNNSCVPNHSLFNSYYQANGIIAHQVNTPYTIAHASESEPQSDPWLHHLLPHGYKPQLDQKLFPHSDTTMVSSTNQTENNNNDPLTTENSIKVCVQQFGCSKMPLYGAPCSTLAASVNSQSLQTFLPDRYNQPHGQHLTQADRDRIHMFVYDFSVRALLPWVEKTMRSLNDQIAHRMRLSRSFFSATKKFFTQAVSGGGGGTSTTISSTNNMSHLAPSKIYTTSSPSEMSTSYDPTNPRIVNSSAGELSSNTTLTQHSVSASTTINHSTNDYSPDSPELQMRRLADLAFLFQQYEVAYQTYNVLRRDFQNDSAWLYYAGAQEMSALAVYLQGTTSQRQSPELALRSTLLNFEALCSRGLYNEAAMALIRLTSDEDDLISGLLIEQIAHCVLSLKRPMLRKFAFRMALAAHRYSRAKQPLLAIRSYKSIMPVVMGHGWSLLEDHINFSVGKQAYVVGDLITSSKALAETLNSSSQQSAERQLIFVKEYLSVLTNLLSAKYETASSKRQGLPEFPLPIIDFSNFKVMIGKPSQQHQQQADLFIEARGIQFSDTEEDEFENDIGNESATLPSSSLDDDNSSFNNVEFQKFTKQYYDWMEATDVSSSSSEESSVDDCDTNRNANCYTHHVNNTNDEYSYNTVTKKVTSPQTMICQRLEYILLQTTLSNDCQSKLNYFKRDKIIYTSRSKYKRTPTFPVGENLTLQITLINPMRIPLVFTNVHLLWIFKLTDSTTRLCHALDTFNSEKHPPSHYHSSPSNVNADNGQGSSITNEILYYSNHSRHYYQQQQETISQYVSGQVINEFIMLPGERKNLQLSLIAKQLGQITITGLGFEWSYLSPYQNNAEHHIVINQYAVNSVPTDESLPKRYSPTASNEFNNLSPIDDTISQITTTNDLPPVVTSINNENHLNSVSERNSVKGKILFNQKTNDNLSYNSLITPPLEWSVTHPAPSLRVFFSSFPSQLYEGQICSVQISLTNSGLIPLTNLRVASVWPGLFAFGSASYDLLPNKRIQYLSIHALKPWIDVPYGQSVVNNNNHTDEEPSILMPSTTITRKLWLRGPHLTCRYVRHRCELELKPSLHFGVVVNCLNMTHINDLLIRIQIKNVVYSTVPMIFQIIQTACISRYWSIQLIQSSFNNDNTPVIHMGEIITLYFKASPIINNLEYAETEEKLSRPISKDGDTSKKFLSIVNFSHHPHNYRSYEFNSGNNINNTDGNHFAVLPHKNNILSTNSLQSAINSCDGDISTISSTQLEFFCRSGINWYHSSGLSETASTNLQQPIWGQSHLRINKLNYPIRIPYCYNNNCGILGFKSSRRKFNKLKRKTTKQHHTEKPDVNEPDLSNLIRFRLIYPKYVYYSQNNNTVDNNSYSTDGSTSYIRSPKDFFEFSDKFPFDLYDNTGLSIGQTKRSFASVPVQAEIYNSSKWPVIVQLDVNNMNGYENESISDNHSQQINPFRVSPSSLSPQLELNIRDSSCIPSLIWIGLTKQQFCLQPHQIKCLKLKALAPRPGIYNVYSFNVKAALSLPCDSHSNMETIKKPLFIDQNILPKSIENHNMISLVIVEQ
ncbi:Trafficking protein particle complex subunit 8 [Schistosoma japonicum]|nr:Trafficking protein particle complex subunit 8 [Schistosoma japonicum]